jgi:hypothetical protein
MRTLIGMMVVAMSLAAPPLAAAQPAGSAAPPANTTALRHTCEAAIAKARAANNRLFVADVSNVAAGTVSRAELAKSPDGQTCLAALDADAEFRSSAQTAAVEAAATERLALTKQEHEAAAAAIAKNEKHVIYAYAAMWLLSAGFLLFLWRRQQGLKTEIAQLKRDLDAAAK